MDFNAARTKFGEVLGVVPGTPEFDGVTAEFASWYDADSSDPEFDNIVRKAEAMFGTAEVLRIAHQLASRTRSHGADPYRSWVSPDERAKPKTRSILSSRRSARLSARR